MSASEEERSMYLAHVGVGWSKKFDTYEDASAYVRGYGLPPEIFVELNLRKGSRS